MRLGAAACELPQEWLSETPEDQRDRVLKELYSVMPMSAASFSCCFPLIKQLLTGGSISEEQRLSLLKVMKTHAGLRSELETVSYIPSVHLINPMLLGEIGSLLFL